MSHLPPTDKPKRSSCIWVAWISIIYWGKKNCEGFWWTSCWLHEGCVGPVHSERETEYNTENLEVSGNFSRIRKESKNKLLSSLREINVKKKKKGKTPSERIIFLPSWLMCLMTPTRLEWCRDMWDKEVLIGLIMI